MSWFRIDDKSAFHRKVMDAGNAAWGALCRMGAYSSDHLLDGKVPAQVAKLIATASELDDLLRVGLLEHDGEGYEIHDFLEWNPSAREVKSLRKKRALAGKKGGAAKQANRVASASDGLGASPKQNAAPSHPIPSHPLDPPVVPHGGTEPALVAVERPSGKRKVHKHPETPAPSSEAYVDEVDAWAEQWGIEHEHPAFIAFLNHHRAKGTFFRDWLAAWRTWLSREKPTGPRVNETPGAHRRGDGGEPLRLFNGGGR